MVPVLSEGGTRCRPQPQEKPGSPGILSGSLNLCVNLALFVDAAHLSLGVFLFLYLGYFGAERIILSPAEMR